MSAYFPICLFPNAIYIMNCFTIEGGHRGRCYNSISINDAIFVALGEKSVSICYVWAVEVFIYLQKTDNTGVKRS